MNRNLTVIFAVAAGFLGGLLSRYISLPAVHAQTATPAPVELRAQRFTIVDGQGAAVGTFTVRSALALQSPGKVPQGPGLVPQSPSRIVLLDQNGREIWSTGTSLKPLSENSR